MPIHSSDRWSHHGDLDQTPTRVAIVTGGSRGIGRAVAETLAADGCAVVIAYVGNQGAADEAVAAITAAGGTASAVRADIADELAIASLFETVERDHGGVDVVVNAAGIMPLGTVADFDLDELDAVLRTNVRGTFVVAQQAARRVSRGGATITFSSSVTRFARPGNAAYTMSKGAVEALTLLLARELDGRDVTVNTVAPGAIETEMLDAFLVGREAVREEIRRQSPLERMGAPDDIAAVVRFLAGPGRWINGQILYANGGAI
ncbi:SDR family oxidoreductase [Conexibacter stalactiti]